MYKHGSTKSPVTPDCAFTGLLNLTKHCEIASKNLIFLMTWRLHGYHCVPTELPQHCNAFLWHFNWRLSALACTSTAFFALPRHSHWAEIIKLLKTAVHMQYKRSRDASQSRITMVHSPCAFTVLLLLCRRCSWVATMYCDLTALLSECKVKALSRWSVFFAMRLCVILLSSPRPCKISLDAMRTLP
jgi:hypothetical protein